MFAWHRIFVQVSTSHTKLLLNSVARADDPTKFIAVLHKIRYAQVISVHNFFKFSCTGQTSN
jgi:hypothetical protein